MIYVTMVIEINLNMNFQTWFTHAPVANIFELLRFEFEIESTF